MTPRPATSRTATGSGTSAAWALALSCYLMLDGCSLASALREGKVCTPEAARRAGEDDARSGFPRQESYAKICGVAEPSLNRMYTEAYDAVPEAERSKPSLLRRILH